MGARSVRQAIRDFIAPTTGLSNTYKDEPYFVTGEAWYNDAGVPGTVAYVHLDNEQESRFVLTGNTTTGQRIDYDVSIVILYQYLIPSDEVSPDAWVDGLDDLVDALKARIRSDPKLGTGPAGVIETAGQHNDDLRIARDLPKRQNGIVRSWNVLQFKASEVRA